VTFSTSDIDPAVVLPADYAFTTGDGGDNGVRTFSGGVTLLTVGDQTLTVTDMVSGITGRTGSHNSNPDRRGGRRGRRAGVRTTAHGSRPGVFGSGRPSRLFIRGQPGGTAVPLDGTLRRVCPSCKAWIEHLA
jgi:hypothetical protein